MLVDDYNLYLGKASQHTFPKNKLLQGILKSLEETPQYFFIALNAHQNKGNLNEDGLTQIFIEQNRIQLIKLEIPIHVSAQYVDTFQKTRGRPDIYFTLSEEGKSHEPTFIVEAKRLPTIGNGRETEYVHGATPSGNPNGGIERFKLEKHGIGLKECGLLAFIEADTPKIWESKVNQWISDLEPEWASDEHLTLHSKCDYFFRFSSSCHRKNDTIKLHHFWLYEVKPNIEKKENTNKKVAPPGLEPGSKV